MKAMGKSSGSLENAANVYLSINLNLFQREILKFIELNVELCRSWMERAEVKLTLSELKEKLLSLKNSKQELDLKIKEPLRLMKELPVKQKDLETREKDRITHLTQ